jgi:hypothetical protein
MGWVSKGMTPPPGRKVGHMRLPIDTTRRSRRRSYCAAAVLALHPSIARWMWSQWSARAKPPGSAVAQLTYSVLSNTTAGAWPIARHLDELLAPEAARPEMNRPAPAHVERRGGDLAVRAVRRLTSAAREIADGACVVCQQAKGLTPAHLAPRSQGGCDHADCVVPLCWAHHRAYDTGRLELLPHLEPQWRAEIAHAVSHLGLIGAVRRLAPGRR